MVLPSTPYDAKGLMKTAIRDDNPVVFFEDKMMYQVEGSGAGRGVHHPVRRGRHQARGRRHHPGRDQQHGPGGAGSRGNAGETGISAEVIDPRTTLPLDKQTLIDSAKKTGRAIVIDEGYERYGVTAEIASVIAEGAFYDLDAPVKRMGAMDVPIPFSPVLEDLTVPTPETVAAAARNLCGANQ